MTAPPIPIVWKPSRLLSGVATRLKKTKSRLAISKRPAASRAVYKFNRRGLQRYNRGMGSFQAGNIIAIRSERVVCIAKTDKVRVKVFQIFFGTDGRLFVSFPYFRHRIGLLSSATIPATGTR